MKRIQFISLLLVAVLLLGVLGGCTNTTKPATTDEPDTTTPPVEENEENYKLVTVNVYGKDILVPQLAIDGVELPLVDEPTTISFFTRWSSQYVATQNDMYVYQEMENRTGVHVDYECVSTDDQFQIMYVSQDYADVIRGGQSSYQGGVSKAIEDEIYVDAANYFALTPVWNAWRTVDDEYRKDCSTDAGEYYFNSVQAGLEPAWCGAAFRADWLDAVGLEVPVTYDDWHEALTAFKDQLGATKPLALAPTGYETYCYSLTAGYNIAPGWYHIGDEIHFGFIEEGMREYLTMMHQWYSEGLVDPDFVAQAAMGHGQDGLIDGDTGALDQAVAAYFTTWAAEANGDLSMVAVSSPVKNAGDEYHLRRNNSLTGGVCSFITTAAVARGVDELCARWIDNFYTLDNAYLLTFGEENLDWTFGEDGLPHYTDYYYNHPDGKSNYAGAKMERNGSLVYIWWGEYDHSDEILFKSLNLWQDSSDAAYNLPAHGIVLTSEESEAYASKYADLSTYIDEHIPLFIRGDLSMDEFDQFVTELKKMGVQDCIDIYQAAFDRYNSR